MNPFALSGILNFLSSFFFGFFVFFKDKKSRVFQLWLAFSLSVALWEFGVYKIGTTIIDSELSLFWWRVAYIGVILIPVFFINFVYAWLDIRRKLFSYFSWAFGVFFSALNLWDIFFNTTFFIPGVRPIFNSFFYNVPQPLYSVFVVGWFFLVLFAHYELLRVYKSSVGTKHSQIQYFFLAFLVAYAGGSTCYLVVYGIDFYPYFNFTLPFYPIIMSYAIVRHRLMDIKMVLRQSFVFISSVLSILIPSALVIYYADIYIPSKLFVVSLLMMAAAISVFSPIKDYFYRIANKYFFSSLYDAREVISKMSEGLRSTLDISEVYNLISETLVNSFRAKAVAILKYEAAGNRYVLQFNKNFFTAGRQDFPGNSALQKEFAERSKALVVEEIKSEAYEQYKETIDLLLLLKVAVLVPLNAKDEVLGIIALGEKESGDMYNEEDLRTLETISSQVAIAIKNAQLYDETKKFSQTLQAEVERQTAQLKLANEELQQLDKAKSDFISIASHQLRTPLTAIKGFSSMVLEGSYGKVSAKVGDKIGKIFDSAERLIRLVNDLLDLSHMESGKMEFKFAKVDFDEMVKSVVEELEPNAAKKKLKFTFTAPDKDFWVWADDQKLRQVVMNLTDNAIKYTQQGSVEVSLEHKNDQAIMAVKDTGMGMHPGESVHLFEKFVRGSEASHYHTEGAGVGLYVAKKLIEEHKGKIWAESPGDGQGSTFFMELPEYKGE